MAVPPGLDVPGGTDREAGVFEVVTSAQAAIDSKAEAIVLGGRVRASTRGSFGGWVPGDATRDPKCRRA